MIVTTTTREEVVRLRLERSAAYDARHKRLAAPPVVVATTGLLARSCRREARARVALVRAAKRAKAKQGLETVLSGAELDVLFGEGRGNVGGSLE